VQVLKHHHKEKYTGSLFEYLDRKKKELGNLTLIRGLRNYHDLHDESSIFNFGQDMTDVPFIYFISKSENLHISSGAIRKLQSLGKDVTPYLP
jgi:phosphopantetheine adenylyltransferase